MINKSVSTFKPSVHLYANNNYKCGKFSLIFLPHEFLIQPLAGRSIAPHSGTYLRGNSHSHKLFTRRKWQICHWNISSPMQLKQFLLPYPDAYKGSRLISFTTSTSLIKRNLIAFENQIASYTLNVWTYSILIILISHVYIVKLTQISVDTKSWVFLANAPEAPSYRSLKCF